MTQSPGTVIKEGMCQTLRFSCNLIRGQDQSGTWQRFEYDAAGRLLKIKDDSGTVLETYTYGATRERLVNETSSGRTYYVWGGSSVEAEYTEATSGTTPSYNKSYVYAGSRLLMTETKASGTTETPEFYHPDRLGTQLVTNGSTGGSFRQTTFPFGTSVTAETTGNTNQVFTSYDRSAGTGLDYANNRTYSKGQSRFTQVDPLGMASTSASPQSNNLYGYVQNDPISFVDPTGLHIEVACSWVVEDDGSWSNYECESEYVEDPLPQPFGSGRGNHGDGVGGGGGGGVVGAIDRITPKGPSREDNCRSIRRAINSHIKQANRHLRNYGSDFYKWQYDEFPWNPLTGQLRDYQNHVDQARALTNRYNRECSDQDPPPDLPAFEDVPADLKDWKPFLKRVWDALPNAPTEKQVKEWYGAGGGRSPVLIPSVPIWAR